MLGSGDTRDKVMIAGLAVVIVGAVVALAMSIVSGDEKKGVILPDAYQFQCMACNAQWEWSADEYNAEVRKLGEAALAGPAVAFECPRCHDRRRTAYPMSRCPYPDCGKFYVPARVLQAAGRPVKDPKLCPNCGKDLMEGYKQYGRKK